MLNRKKLLIKNKSKTLKKGKKHFVKYKNAKKGSPNIEPPLYDFLAKLTIDK